MKKFFTDNISWVVILILGVAVAALVLSILNRKNVCGCKAEKHENEIPAGNEADPNAIKPAGSN